MNMIDLICKKRDKEELTKEEIEYMIKGYVDGDIPDYQMSAMCMAIVLNGMSDDEILNLTLAMLHSGDTIDLSQVDGVTIDKHSTGGVGDKTSIALCPMIASVGLKIAKMSGRGLGHTGGTLDKLESIEGFNTSISEEEFINNVNKIGIAITGQTAEIDPADKKLYALRDVTGTVPAIPLIVSSIMSKKLASGAEIIVLDTKCGDGSFMKTFEEAELLATKMVEIGKKAGKKCAAIITDMDQPLGTNIGNALEVIEAVETLQGKREGDFLELCLALGSRILILAEVAKSDDEARKILLDTIKDGSAFDKLVEMVEAQYGDSSVIKDLSLMPKANVTMDVVSAKEGFIKKIKTEQMGLISMKLGGGRETKDDIIDYSVGLVIEKKVGDFVNVGEVLATIHAANEESAKAAVDQVLDCYTFTNEKYEKPAFIKGVVT